MALLSSFTNTSKILDCLFATVLNGMPGVSLTVDQRLASWLASEVSEVRPNSDTLARNRHNQSEKSHQHATRTQHHDPVVPLPPLSLLSFNEH